MNNDEELTFEVLSLYGDTWYAGLSLLLWFGYGSYQRDHVTRSLKMTQ